MRKLALGLSLIMLAVMATATIASAKGKPPKGYVYTDRRYDYVKFEKLGGGEYKGITAKHPATFTESQMEGILASLKLDKKATFSKDIKTREVFDDKAVSTLAPYIVKAFEQVTPEQRIVFSYLSKEPMFIIRNDRLTIGSMWMQDDGLHIRFDKVFAKLQGDTDKMGYQARKVNRSTDTRTSIEAVEGQQLVAGDELLVDTNFNFVLSKPLEDDTKKDKRVVVTDKGKKGAAEAAAVQAAYDPQKSAKERLLQLDALYKDKLITKEDYENKKKEILNQL